MADGEINRNGATIRIDDDGGVQVEPAEGQEVEYTGPDRGTDAIRDSVNTDEVNNAEWVDDDPISDALEDAAEDNDIIFVPKGTYEADGRITINSKASIYLNNATLEATHEDFTLFRLDADDAKVIGGTFTVEDGNDLPHAIDLIADRCKARGFSVLNEFDSTELRTAGDNNSFVNGVARDLTDNGQETITSGVTPLDL